MKRFIPIILAVILAFVLVVPAAADETFEPLLGVAVTRIPIATHTEPSVSAPVVCALPTGVNVALLEKVDIGTARWWKVRPEVMTTGGAICDGWLKSGALTGIVVFEPVKKAR